MQMLYNQIFNLPIISHLLKKVQNKRENMQNTKLEKAVERLDNTLDLMLNILIEAQKIADQSNNKDFVRAINKLEIIKDRLINYNLAELANM